MGVGVADLFGTRTRERFFRTPASGVTNEKKDKVLYWPKLAVGNGKARPGYCD